MFCTSLLKIRIKKEFPHLAFLTSGSRDWVVVLSLWVSWVFCANSVEWEFCREIILKFDCRFEMASTSRRIEIEKFNGGNFELWKLKMEDLLVDHELWDVVSSTRPATISQDDWDTMDWKAKGLIRLCLVDSVLLNVHEEKTAKSLWKKLGDIYQGKSLVNKLFLRKKLYSLKMEEGASITDHLNLFNMIIAQLTSVGVKIEDEDHCMLLLCSLLDTWDHLVMAIGSTTTTFKMEDVVASLLLEEMQRKSSKMAKEALVV